MKPTEGQSKHFTTADGVRLNYFEAGSGKPLVLIHGWSQCAEEFKHQIAGLSGSCRVIAIDQRGHGEPAKPGFGYKIHRLSKDLRELIIKLELTDVTVLGHSMGCSVIWGYWNSPARIGLQKLSLSTNRPILPRTLPGRRLKKRPPGPFLLRLKPPMISAIPWRDRTAKRPPALSSAAC